MGFEMGIVEKVKLAVKCAYLEFAERCDQVDVLTEDTSSYDWVRYHRHGSLDPCGETKGAGGTLTSRTNAVGASHSKADPALKTTTSTTTRRLYLDC